MSITNILISGVGGQGLVVATKILAEAAFKEDYDIKTSDVIGLSQRGGMVWGSVRFGKKVHSALIPNGQCDILIAMEALEGLRWAKMMKASGKVILATEKTYPNRVLIEKEEYPADIEESLHKLGLSVLPVKAQEEAKRLGNIKASNMLLLGILSSLLPFSKDTWVDVISYNVPKETVDINLAAFNRGIELAYNTY